MRTGALLLAIAAGLLGPTALAQNATVENPVVATVNGEQIWHSEVVMFQTTLPPQYKTIPLNTIYDDLLTNLINRKLIVQAARAEGMDKMETVRQRLAFHLDGLLQEQYLKREVEANLTEDRLRAAYERLLRLTPPKEELRARHILVENRDTANDLIQQIEAGADFATLAQRHSKGPSATSGGDLGYFGRDQMVPEFAQVAFTLEPGTVSKKPVHTKYGWHIIKVEDRRAAPPPSFEESAPQIQREESRAIVAGIVQDLSKEAKVIRVERKSSAEPKAE